MFGNLEAGKVILHKCVKLGVQSLNFSTAYSQSDA